MSKSMLTPDGRVLPLRPDEDRPAQVIFNQTGVSGISRLIQGSVVRPGELGTAVAAMNVPAEESSLERIDPAIVRSLLEGYPVSFTRANGNVGQLSSDDTSQIARLSFPLAALALGLLLGEVLLSWSIGRTAMRSGKTGQVNADGNTRNSNTRPINSG